jgi:hypothetical protein
MIKDIIFPESEDFLVNLALQRTGPLIQGGGANEFNKWVNSGDKTGINILLKDKYFLSNFLNSVQKEIQQELANFFEAAPEIDTKSIVSIGPGNGIFELALMQTNPESKILLIDIETTNSHHHGFFKKGAGYANLLATKDFLVNNKISEDRIYICNPTKTSLPEFKFSLAISTLSMGFHYPCDEYSQFLISNKMQSSYLVFDKRKNEIDQGFDEITRFFTIENVIESNKSYRLFLSGR